MTGFNVRTAFDAATIRSEVEALAERVAQDFADDDLLVISLLSGSVIFVADLVRSINRPLRFEFLQVEQTGDGEGDEPLQIYFPMPVDVRDQRVLLVKDVVSTGIIETYLCQQLGQLGVRDAKVVALVDIRGERKTAFEPDYKVFHVERRGTLVGYGLKHDGHGGNLPYLAWREA